MWQRKTPTGAEELQNLQAFAIVSSLGKHFTSYLCWNTKKQSLLSIFLIRRGILGVIFDCVMQL